MADAEIDAMGKVSTALEALDDDARHRVLRWAGERYGVVLAGAGKGGDRANLGRKGANAFGDTGDDQEFGTLADLYDAARPKTDAERALVGAYWIWKSEGKAEFQAQPVNTALKNLGHALSNVTDALTSLKSRKPALVLQLEKHGKTRQGRKTYKITTAGERAVQQMIAGTFGQQEE